MAYDQEPYDTTLTPGDLVTWEGTLYEGAMVTALWTCAGEHYDAPAYIQYKHESAEYYCVCILEAVHNHPIHTIIHVPTIYNHIMYNQYNRLLPKKRNGG